MLRLPKSRTKELARNSMVDLTKIQKLVTSIGESKARSHSLFWVCQTVFIDLWEHDEKDNVIWWNKIQLFGHIIWLIHLCWEAWWRWHHASEGHHNSRDRATGQNWGMEECSQTLGKKTAPKCMRPVTEVMVYSPVQQWSEETRQDKAGVFSGQVSNCVWLWYNQSSGWKSKKETWLEEDNLQTLSLLSNGAWEDLSGRMR